MTNSTYAAFVALDPFFDIVMQGLAGAVDGDHYFDAIADNADRRRGRDEQVGAFHAAGMAALHQHRIGAEREEAIRLVKHLVLVSRLGSVEQCRCFRQIRRDDQSVWQKLFAHGLDRI